MIAPHRARRAGLAYLALGDWHGALAVDSLRTRYSGTPEPDRFKHDRPGGAAGEHRRCGGAARGDATADRGFAWCMLDMHLLDGDDPVAAMDRPLPDARQRRQTLARSLARGRCRLPARIALAAAAANAAPDFALLELNDAELAIDCEIEDLDRIDCAGALREAANALLTEAADESRAAADRDIARAALARLFAYAQDIAS